MQQLRIIVLSLCMMGMLGSMTGQGLHFGIRAGLNYSKFLGPLEKEGADERFKLNNGFHFGMMIEYEVSDIVSFRTELLYTQNGNKQKYDGTSYYRFPIGVSGELTRVSVIDSVDIDLDISNAYVSIPITAHFRTLEKWDIYGGAYVNFMVSSIGRGILRFGGSDTLTIDHQFQQGLNYNYRTDTEVGFRSFGNSNIGIRANGLDVNLPSFVGAYYQHDEKNGNAFTSVDYGLVAGINYFLNPGLYIGLRCEYGMRDITNDRMDRSLRSLNDDNTFQFRDDDDRHLGFNISLGFRF